MTQLAGGTSLKMQKYLEIMLNIYFCTCKKLQNLDCEKVKHELQVKIQELRVKIYELRVQIHELRVQIHELEN